MKYFLMGLKHFKNVAIACAPDNVGLAHELIGALRESRGNAITKSPTTTEAKDGKIPKNPFVMDEIVISVPKSKNVNPNNDNNETDNK